MTLLPSHRNIETMRKYSFSSLLRMRYRRICLSKGKENKQYFHVIKANIFVVLMFMGLWWVSFKDITLFDIDHQNQIMLINVHHNSYILHYNVKYIAGCIGYIIQNTILNIYTFITYDKIEKTTKTDIRRTKHTKRNMTRNLIILFRLTIKYSKCMFQEILLIDPKTM